MKVESIDRVFVAVKDLEAASKLFSDILGLKFGEVKVDEGQQTKYTRSAIGLELIQSTTPDGPVARSIERRGEGLYAAVLKVSDIGLAIEELQKKGLRLLGQSKIGGLKEAFFHPRDSHGLMIALCEYESEHGATIAESKS